MTLLPAIEAEVRRIEQHYRDAGYEVLRAPALWPAAPDLRPDLVARKPNETVVIEVVTATEMHERDGKLTKLAHAVSHERGWRLEVHSLGKVTPKRPVPLNNLDTLVVQVRQLLNEQLWIPAILTSWTIIEGSLRELLSEESTNTSMATPRALIKDAFSLGLLSRGTLDMLLELASVRNALAHGLNPPGSTDLQSTAQAFVLQAEKLRQLLDPEGETSSQHSVEELVKWFLENYEDPAQGVPFDSGEGGYQYIAGGPYDPRDELQDQFPDVDETALEQAVQRIADEGGWEWVKRGQY